ncbi:SDR family NAD(P)-dependent oxidoreductase [Altericroceibacterium xinjiangense]|uniref:SDR family NAD(P)-dependent oxidoreductase n=1 Tax=Altericroceibacterium xinjiangense TaxID=762261 RepID=UPI000F7E26DC|nr:SDR family NAD(P)-dependent oxidoreductase [Altericroceibacterium xinjiangense]
MTQTANLSLAGTTALVTGATDGLGRAAARALAAQGAHVIVHGRNPARGEALVDEITRSGTGSASFRAADFSSLEAVRAFADRIASDHPKLDLLVNNAGVAFPTGEPRHTSADGHELQFAVNYLAGWVLVNRLRPNLAAAAPSRVINVSSIAADPIDFADVMLEQPGAQDRGYGQSKLAQVTMTVALAPAFARDGITMAAMHPATLMNTTMVSDLRYPPQTSVDEGLEHLMALVTAPTLEPGAFYIKAKTARPYDPQPSDPDARDRLLELSEQLTGVSAE